MQIKITLRYHYMLPFSMAKTNKTKPDNSKRWQASRVTRTLQHCWRECKMERSLWKITCQLLIKCNIHVLYDPDIPFLGFYPRKME